MNWILKVSHKYLWLLLFFSVCLTGCGQKGSLYLPAKVKPESTQKKEAAKQQQEPKKTTASEHKTAAQPNL